MNAAPLDAVTIDGLMVLVVFGTRAAMQGSEMAANLPTPWMGNEERINIFGYYLWAALLAVGLLRARGTTELRGEVKPTAISRAVAR